MSNKELAIEAIRELPDDASLEQIAERIQMLAAVGRAPDDSDVNLLVRSDELQRWIAG
jgi:hypothetical protein